MSEVTSTPPPQTHSPAAWALRAYAWVVVLAAIVLGVAAPVLHSLRPTTFEATALVVAQQLELSAETLPRYGEAVFDSGSVALAIASSPQLDVDPATVIPERLRVVSSQDSIVFQVIGEDVNASTAVQLANEGAEAFVVELNRGGAGVGTFALQSPAQTATTAASSGQGPVVLVVLGIVAGVALGLGLIALFVTLWDPIVDAAQAQARIGVRSLGPLPLPTPRRGPPDLGTASDLAPLARWLATAPVDALVLVGPRHAAGLRARLLDLLGSAPLQQLLMNPGRQSSIPEGVAEGGRLRMLVDGDAAVDEMKPTDAFSSVLVVPVGMPRRQLTAMAAQLGENEPYGIVLTHWGTRRNRRRKADPFRTATSRADASGSAARSERPRTRAPGAGRASAPAPRHGENNLPAGARSGRPAQLSGRSTVTRSKDS